MFSTPRKASRDHVKSLSNAERDDKDDSSVLSILVANRKKTILLSTPTTIADTPSSTPDNTPILEQEKQIIRTVSKKMSLGSLLPSNSIGSLWSIEMTSLRTSTSYFEAVECLRRIRCLLSEIDKSDRIKFCKADYENSTKLLKKQKQVWSDDLFREVVAITSEFFCESFFQKLPTDLVIEIFLWLPINRFAPITSVCWEWCEIGCSDAIWGCFYRQKFLVNNPGAMPSPSKEEMIVSFHSRLKDPQVGDKVEVAWRGKFRLETQDVYQGLAWWVAEVVDKHISHGRYKIRYPGWESRWDEWVPRQRLRWAVNENTVNSINVNDIVELWCCGANVPGAWLESKVKKVRGGRYCIGRVISSGYLWVERDRLRLVRSAAEQSILDSQLEESGRSVRGRRRTSLLSSITTSLSERFADMTHLHHNDGMRNASCVVM